MKDGEQQGFLKGHKLITGVTALIIVAGLAVGVVLLATSKHPATAQSHVSTQQQSTNNQTAASAYKLATCTSGTTQTIANASYAVGTDIAPGNYKIVSQAAGIGWTNIDVYNSKSDYDKSQNPNSNVADNSFQATNQDDSAETPAPTYTKLTDGQYMVVAADPSTFTCE